MAIRRQSRRREPRIIDITTYPRRDVCLAVAADFLDRMDHRALNHYIESGSLPAFWKGRRRRVRVSDLIAFKAWLNSGAPRVQSDNHSGNISSDMLSVRPAE